MEFRKIRQDDFVSATLLNKRLHTVSPTSADWQVYDALGQRKYLNAQERQRFLDHVEGVADVKRALCLVLAYSGCRVSEALQLRYSQVEPGCIIFRTLKRRKRHFRAVPVPLFVTDLLLSMATGQGDAPLFTIHRSTAWRWIERAMQHACITGPQACPKGLRHGFGMRAATGSVPGRLIQRWMGHARRETTDHYLEAVGDEERYFAARMW